VRGGEYDPDREKQVMIAAVADGQGRLYHEVLAALFETERRFGRRAAMEDLMLAFRVQQERARERKRAYDRAKPRRKG